MRRLRLVQGGEIQTADSPASKFADKFPEVTFRKKRLTVAIHVQFDMQNAFEVDVVKAVIAGALARHSTQGEVQITYTVSDV